MRGLYENAMAVVMPTYFGPTNLPPIEAWTLGVPVIYSKHLSEQAGNAALLVDPDCQLDVALAMLQCNKLEIRNQLVRAGYRRIIYLDNLRKVAENELCASIKSYAARRLCWD
jgi:glycosyltransferase involved in cell wall biosynthesis